MELNEYIEENSGKLRLNEFCKIFPNDGNILKYPDDYFVINDRIWAVKESIVYSKQSEVSGNNLCGFILEILFLDKWLPFKNKIYANSIQALTAYTMCYDGYSIKPKFRIRPVYTMDDSEYREFQLSELLDTKNKKNNELEIKCWKATQDFTLKTLTRGDISVKRGTIYIKYNKEKAIKIKSKKEPVQLWAFWELEKAIENNWCEPIDFMSEKWFHSHIIKSIRNNIN